MGMGGKVFYYSLYWKSLKIGPQKDNVKAQQELQIELAHSSIGI